MSDVKHVVVVGGGWAGYSVADSLSSSPDVRVTLLEASPRASGGLAGGWRTPGGRPVEAGIHGFWREYLNTFQVIDSLGLDRDEVLGPYSPSVLFAASSGKVATAPVLAVDDAGAPAPTSAFPPLTPDALLQRVAQLLPAPLDTALLADFSPTSRLTPLDRASAVGLLGAWADFGQEDPESWARYDDVTAEELFVARGGCSDALYEDMVSPLLHVLPMGPGYDISAAAALSCFHVFALQSRGAFDVRWGRGGLTPSIFLPWQTQLEARGNVELRSGARVAGISGGDGDGARLSVAVVGQEDAPIDADAVVLAVGATSAARLAEASPALRDLPSCARWSELRGITCVAVRLFLEPAARATTGLGGGAHSATLLPAAVAQAMAASPVAVVGPKVLPELEETGFCIYDLQRMHDEFASGDVAVLEVDFYRADQIAEIEDDAEVVSLALRAAAAALKLPASALDASAVVDSAVVRARRAVSHFATGSAALSPPVRLGGGVYAAGDWIDRAGHASWSTEKAVVTGRQAAGAIGRDLGLTAVDSAVIPAAEDTAQLQALRGVAKAVRAAAPADLGLPPPAPWAALRSLLSGPSASTRGGGEWQPRPGSCPSPGDDE